MIASNELPIQLFVYGTLISGYSNHFLMEGCSPRGPAKTVEDFSLHVHEYPFVSSKKHTTTISGEVYQINTVEQLEALDLLEEAPGGLHADALQGAPERLR